MIELIRRNANVNSLETKGPTPLSLANTLGNVEVVEELIRNQADVDKKSVMASPLYLASKNGKELWKYC